MLHVRISFIASTRLVLSINAMEPITMSNRCSSRVFTIFASATFAAVSLMPMAINAQEAPSAPSAITQPGLVSDNPVIQAAIDFTRNLTDKANDAFTNTADEDAQLLNFQRVLTDGLALDLLGRFMLGEHRNSLTDDQRTRYEAIFPEYITRLYAEQFKDIAGKQLVINDATPFSRRDVIVRTQFSREDGTPVNVDWRARKFRDENHKMIDIIVSGVSIMTVKREEFTSFISTNGIDALITRLEEEAAA